MREIELKAHAADPSSVRSVIESIAGEGKAVDKADQYFRVGDSVHPALRIRRFNDHMEFTAKKNSKNEAGENNLEYEIQLGLDQYDNAVMFFRALGYEEYFIKLKKGYEWTYDGTHIELLKVNDIGWFLEMEILLPFDSSEELLSESAIKLHRLLHQFSLSEGDIENRSYRSMILGR